MSDCKAQDNKAQDCKAQDNRDLMYRLLVQEVTDYAIFMLSPEGYVSNWNAGAERAKGYKAEEIVGQHFSRFYTEPDRQSRLPERALLQARTKGKFESEGWRLRKDGTRFWAHVVIDPIRDASGTLLGYAKITRDLTEQKEHSDRVQAVTRNLEIALANMSQGLCLFNAEKRLLLLNQRFHEMFGLTEEAIRPGATLDQVMWHVFGDTRVGDRARDTLTDGAGAGDSSEAEQPRYQNGELDALACGEQIVTFEVSRQERFIAISHRALAGGGWVLTMDDITEHRRIESRVLHLAHHDALTDLPNRIVLQGRLHDLLHPAETVAQEPQPESARDVKCALLYLDLDRFKPVNDSLGHSAGDELLCAVAQRIQDTLSSDTLRSSTLRSSDLVARVGGDEFVILQASCQGRPDASALAERVIQALSLPFTIKDMQVLIGVSIGISLAPYDGCDADLLLRNADLALYRAKTDGRSCYRYYNGSMEAEAQQRRELEHDLREALHKGQFALHYQPIVDLDRNRLTSFEALLRWQSPTRGRVSPADFIPFAEEIGLMPEVGDWVLETACREAMRWAHATRVSVNLSATQFRRAGLVEKIMATLGETGLPPERLELEVTETAMIHDIEGATKVLNQLRALGIHIALDDFGTGYSSLSFLRSLPFTRIKIDRSFIKEFGAKPEATAIVRAVAGLCSSLGVAVTAEGVETEQQAKMLMHERDMEAQGYWISHPLPASDIADLVASFALHPQSPDAAKPLQQAGVLSLASSVHTARLSA